MMQIQALHDWDVTPKEAVTIQKQLAPQVITDVPLPLETVRHIAGVDVSVKNDVSQAAVVVMSYPDMTPIETVTAQMPTPFPYVPGLLTFREGPVLERAFADLQHEPDLFMFDGMGQIHPRRMGIASHMGLWLQKPTLGVGKTHFIGTYDTPDEAKGAHTDIYDNGEVIGAVLRTRARVKPVYVSVGHMMDLASALALALACAPKYRLPRPIRLAHNAAGTL